MDRKDESQMMRKNFETGGEAFKIVILSWPLLLCHGSLAFGVPLGIADDGILATAQQAAT
ncbi:hypothetical protein K402DRAFT_388348 [Aulographum hederae CBS 113979]|uniref:Uncharacterized protein n=1 Tax=Aulographum hederae CBS 113979 TaxID=1176131 RepID=A0A6G1HFH6_9PEZI|nr:hypothetical protein K402DRAFT_388348 [Aulographum hederae CBS 113979]